MRDDPRCPSELRSLLRNGGAPPPLDSATREASAAFLAQLGGAATPGQGGSAAAGALKLIVGLSLGATLLGGAAIFGWAEEPARAPGSAASASAGAEVDPPPVRASEVAGQLGFSETEGAAPGPMTTNADAATTERATAPAPPSPRPGGGARSRRARQTESSLATEVHLLERARALLASRPQGSLALARQHAREHPRGQLAAERELIAIDALRRLGRHDEARRRAARLMAQTPNGIYADRARSFVRDLEQEL